MLYRLHFLVMTALIIAASAFAFSHAPGVHAETPPGDAEFTGNPDMPHNQAPESEFGPTIQPTTYEYDYTPGGPNPVVEAVNVVVDALDHAVHWPDRRAQGGPPTRGGEHTEFAGNSACGAPGVAPCYWNAGPDGFER